MKRKRKNEDAGLLFEETGMSQQAILQYTGANQSTLSRHLAGTRLLPGEAGLKLVNMIVQLVKLPKQPLVQTLTTEEKEELQQAANWYRTQCIPLQKKLDAMQAEAAKAARLLQFVDALEKEEREIADAKQRWYDSQRYTAQSKLEKNSRYQQVKLEAKMAALQAESEMYEIQLVE